jgi:hypothetical protein
MRAKPIDVTSARKAAPRLWSHVQFSDDCWLWTKTKTTEGYGRTSFAGSVFYVHRVLFAAQFGVDPGECEVDHTCTNPSCVRPDHLEAVTPLENLKRSNAKSAHAVRTGRCINDHDLTDPENVYHWKGSRLCVACRAENNRKSLARRDTPEFRENRKSYLKAYRLARKESGSNHR